ncbi:uncharacterized protein LOC144122018 [Amblyomma americanum]
MGIAKFLLGCLLSAFLCGASPTLLDLNPDLGPFQDERECFPLEETWHLIYRDFEDDPYLGGKSKCVTGTQTGTFIGDSAYVYFEFPPGKKLNTSLKLMSSPGYTAKNILNFTPFSAPDKNINLTIAYRDCHSCKVIRHSYINNGVGCSMWVTDHELRIPHPCCDYVFELLCGFNPTYKMFDESCL